MNRTDCRCLYWYAPADPTCSGCSPLVEADNVQPNDSGNADGIVRRTWPFRERIEGHVYDRAARTKSVLRAMRAMRTAGVAVDPAWVVTCLGEGRSRGGYTRRAAAPTFVSLVGRKVRYEPGALYVAQCGGAS